MESHYIIWKLIDIFFKNNTNFAVKHHLDSFNYFFKEEIKKIFQEKNPMRILKERDQRTKLYKYECNLFFGGKGGDQIYYGKPIIFDNDYSHFMYPNEARLRNMTYGFSIHYDLLVEYIIRNNDDDEAPIIQKSITLEKIPLGRFPIMLHSDLCILKGLSRDVRYHMGECRNDYGGYFIIDGKEKVVICQEKFADNMLYIRDKVNDTYSHSANIRSVSEDTSKPERTLSVRIVAPSEKLTNNQIVVNIPNVRNPIPLFIVMRALGVESDKDIIKYCISNIEKQPEYLELFRPSIHDAGYIFTQISALKYIASFTKGKTINSIMEILSNYFFPHIGELNFKHKALYLGYIVKRLLDVYLKKELPTDRDNFKFKRIETTGHLIYQLF